MSTSFDYSPPRQTRSSAAPCCCGCVVLMMAVAVAAVLAFNAGVGFKQFWDWVQQHALQQHPAVGRQLDRTALLKLEPLTGTAAPLEAEDLNNRVLLVNFWGTWCPPCLAELPHIAALERKYRHDPRVRVLAVSCAAGLGPGMQEDVRKLKEETEATLAERNVDLPTYADPRSIARAAVDAVAGFDGYPTTLILDRQGVIRGVWVGYTPAAERQMQRLIEQLLAED
jgi:cytochrome c biogenesis protein CcmG/thiol:disulfide interchange protein DsbE